VCGFIRVYVCVCVFVVCHENMAINDMQMYLNTSFLFLPTPLSNPPYIVPLLSFPMGLRVRVRVRSVSWPVSVFVRKHV